MHILLKTIHCKHKVSLFPVPSPDVTDSDQTLPALSGITKLFPARESLVSDIPAGDGKMANLFYSVVGIPLGKVFKETELSFKLKWQKLLAWT